MWLPFDSWSRGHNVTGHLPLWPLGRTEPPVSEATRQTDQGESHAEGQHGRRVPRHRRDWGRRRWLTGYQMDAGRMAAGVHDDRLLVPDGHPDKEPQQGPR